MSYGYCAIVNPMPKQKIAQEQGVVASVFESFVEALRADTSLDSRIAEDFKSALSETPELSADAVRRVLFPNEPMK